MYIATSTHGCNLAQENHSGFNIPNQYFLKYQMCDLEWFYQILLHMISYVTNSSIYLLYMAAEVSMVTIGNKVQYSH